MKDASEQLTFTRLGTQMAPGLHRRLPASSTAARAPRPSTLHHAQQSGITSQAHEMHTLCRSSRQATQVELRIVGCCTSAPMIESVQDQGI